MRKFLKIILIGAGVFAGVLLLLSLALRVFLPSAKLRRMVEEQIRSQLNRQAQLGEVDLGLRGITLGRFKLSEVPSFAAGGTFLVVDKLDVRWALMPLLSRTVLIRAVVLEKPQINLIRKAGGKTMNISDLMEASSTNQQHPSPTPLPSRERARPTEGRAAGEGWSWAVQKVHLKNGAIRFDDRSPARQTSTLSDIDLVIRDFNPTQVQGQLSVKQLQNPVYTARDFSLEWALKGIDPTFGKLSGEMRLKQGPGRVQNLDRLANSSSGAKLALMPLVMLQNLDRLGFVKLGLPDFSRLEIKQIEGRYTFKEGTMKIDHFEILSTQATIGALGTVELASGKLAVDVSLHTPQPVLMGEMDLKMSISGTLSNPKTNLDHLKKKAFKATVNQLLDKPGVQKKIDDTLKQLFR